METEWGFPIESEKERGFSIFKSEEEITREMKKRFQEFIALRQKDVQSKISVQCDNVTIEKITDLLLDIRFINIETNSHRLISNAYLIL